ncbi:MAG: CbiX/SirB N-terminal domain-containing protein [Microthrixaceae bacterium]
MSEPPAKPDSSAGAGVARVVVVAHGSRETSANEEHRRLCRALGEEIGRPVTAAFLELADPGIGTAIAGCAAEGASRIDVLPYFLNPGRHVRVDIPRQVDEAVALLGDDSAVAVRVLPHVGAAAAMVTLLASQLAVPEKPPA